MLLQPLYFIENFDVLVSEVMNLINSVEYENNQIICQSLESNPGDWKIGTGSIEELTEQEEKKYCHLNPNLKGSYIEKIINHHKAYRTRIMIMPSRKCYSIHADPSKRIHLPIMTNDQCWMIWPKYNACYQMSEKKAYLTDTTKPHTFINGSLENRIHVVMCVDS